MNPMVSSGVTARTIPSGWSILLLLVTLAVLALGSPGAFARPGPFVKLTGKVTNSLTGLGVPGATVTLTATGTTIVLTTNAQGVYSNGKVQVGTYNMTVAATNYNNSSQSVSLLKGTVVVNVPLAPVARVIVSAGVSGTATPGGSITATGSYIIMDGSTVTSSGWSQGAEGVPVSISAGNTATVSMPNADTYAAHLIQILEEPPISEADLPPDLVLQPINQIAKNLQDRNQVVAINPMAMEEADALPLVYSVTTTSGTYTKAVSTTVSLPWRINSGVRTVPVNSTVLLYGKNSALGYNWEITAAPGGSSYASPNNFPVSADTQTPWFTPDVVGTYEITETNSLAVVEVHAGRYHGVIDPLLTLSSVQLGDGRPVADQNCTGCHTEGGAAPANFDTWRNTGHAEAFTQGITTNSHFGEGCFACHAVGFGTTSGIDSTPNYGNFITALTNAQHGGDITTLWTNMLTNQPDTARLSNIQCENCHGPQDYAESHHTPDGTIANPGAPRVNLGAEMCGSCHGEPARHGRFQQWLLSNHADYNLARSRGLSSNCARCHSGNGFVEWSKFGFNPAETLSGKITWNADTVVPQVCAACHNPHDTGTTSGSDETNAKVRVNADGTGACGDPTCNTNVLLAGFKAISVGKGATCMTCHNSRASFYDSANNLVIPTRDDSTWALSVANNRTTDRPHHGVQADLIMGQNMYFFAPGEMVRGKHSLIQDTCVTCHMNKTQPPDILSYNQSGTNHTFAADPNICSQCHGSDPNANNIDLITTGYMDDLQNELGAAYLRIMESHYPVAVGSTCGTADGTTVTVTDVFWNERATRLNITLSNGNTCGNRDPASITIDNGTPAAQSLFNYSLNNNGGALLKAAWNWSMNFEDETINGCVDENDPTCTPPHTHRGVHNPDFQIKSLTRAIAAVQAVSP